MFVTFFDSHSVLKVHDMNMESPTTGGVPIVKIDGDKVRKFREEKGLTQLYVSTVVGVTTDTISRWENRRYPTIKKENAHKLAEALEVELELILDHGDQEDSDQDSRNDQRPSLVTDEFEKETIEPAPSGIPVKTSRKIPWYSFAGLSLLLAILVLGFYWWRVSEPPADILITRFLPQHSPPGEPFPVIITIGIDPVRPSSLIVKEILPHGCRAVNGYPQFTAVNEQEGYLKWISKIAEKPAVFSYIATPVADSRVGEKLIFNGTVTMRQADSGGTTIGGNNILSIEPYHWADSNKDGRIDDEEILTVYDIYGAIQTLDIDKELIEEIWSAKGYSWDGQTGQFVISP